MLFGEDYIRYFSEGGLVLHRTPISILVDKYIQGEGKVKIDNKFSIVGYEPEFNTFFETKIVEVEKSKNLENLIKMNVKDIGLCVSINKGCLQTVKNMYNGTIETLAVTELDTSIHQLLVERAGWFDFTMEEVDGPEFVYNIGLDNGSMFPVNNIFVNSI